MAGREQADERMSGEVSVTRRWAEYLVAILGGTVVYMFAEPGLPTVMQHHVPNIDLGLGINFLFCVVAYGFIRLARAWNSTSG
jgi:hypothetical protein